MVPELSHLEVSFVERSYGVYRYMITDQLTASYLPNQHTIHTQTVLAKMISEMAGFHHTFPYDF